jgi:CubicO group peptidase (beta-lactamase class C family)
MLFYPCSIYSGVNINNN